MADKEIGGCEGEHVESALTTPGIYNSKFLEVKSKALSTEEYLQWVKDDAAKVLDKAMYIELNPPLYNKSGSEVWIEHEEEKGNFEVGVKNNSSTFGSNSRSLVLYSYEAGMLVNVRSDYHFEPDYPSESTPARMGKFEISFREDSPKYIETNMSTVVGDFADFNPTI